MRNQSDPRTQRVHSLEYVSDPRAKGYIAKYGRMSWELDALKPEVLMQIAEEGILEYLDYDKYEAWVRLESEQKKALEDFGKKLDKEGAVKA
jgi:hypothetical protein